MHCITLNPGSFAWSLPEEDEFQAIGHLFVATINFQSFALFSNPETFPLAGYARSQVIFPGSLLGMHPGT